MANEQFTHPLIASLPGNYRAFLSGATQNQIDALEYAQQLHRKDLITSVIPQQLETLRMFQTPPEIARHDGVRKGWELLREYFQSKRMMFKKAGVVPLIYGSMEYDDPVNLDFDILLVGVRDYAHIDVFANEYHSDLIFGRKWLNNNEGHVSYTSIEKLDELIHMVREGDNEQIEMDAWRIDDQFGNASVVLSGVPLYPEDASALVPLQKAIWQRVQREPLLAAVVAQSLMETVEARMERR